MSGLRCLHLLANYKWTGPADPAIRCAQSLRRAGADAVFAQAEWTLPGAEHRMRIELARARMPVIAGLELRKHFQPASVVRDARALRQRLRRGDFDVVHCHLPGDHLIAALARRTVRCRLIVVRSLYDPEPPRRRWRERIALRATDGVVAPTRACADAVADRFGLARERVLCQEPPVEPRPRTGQDLRARLGLTKEHVAIGITARIQPHRRFDLLWETCRRVVAAEPRARLVLLGRGNERDTRALVHEPVARLGLTQHVVLPGYLHEPDYGRALEALDLFVFLVPGSDGTCRAVREAMALGVPVVATRRGMLPELLAADPERLVPDPCGIACAEDPEALAAALLRLSRDGDLRARLGASALAKARGPMNPMTAATRLLAFYGRLLEMPRC